MIDDIKTELKEVKDNLYLVKAGMQQIDNKEQIDNALFSIVRSLDRIIDEIDENTEFSSRL
jgi:hypothetical protein